MGGAPKLPDPKMFFLGSVDFMVTNYDGERKFVILEANGGSSRGFMSTGSDQIEMMFNAYKTAIDSVSKDDETRILIGTLPNDDLFQEKILLTEFLKGRYEVEGDSVQIYNSYNYNPQESNGNDKTIIISNYNNILENLSYKNQHIAFKDKKIDIIIGDGVARRFPLVGAYIKNDWKRVKTLIINPIYPVTDDKANTYLAAYFGQKILNEYRVQPLQFKKVIDPYFLEGSLEDVITENQKNFVIKPFGGSGGVGVQAILTKHSKDDIPQIMGKSISDFYDKFDPRRNPFPYTLQEMAQFELIDFKETKRTYDVRIYVIQQDGHL